MKEALEPWSGTQKVLPVLMGLVLLVVGVLLLGLALPDMAERWKFVPWGVLILFGGLFLLYIRMSILPSVRVFE